MSTINSSSSSDIRSDYMNLLITQLKNQNPLEPVDNNQMTMQLSQISQLEQLENMSGTFSQVLQNQMDSSAMNLVGKQVSFFPEDSETAVTGVVDKVTWESGTAQLRIGKHLVNPEKIQSVEQPLMTTDFSESTTETD